MADLYAGVFLLDNPFVIDHIFDYLVPRSLSDVVHRGSFVTVPFGNGNRKKLALVAEVRENTEAKKIKPILAVSTDRISLTEEMMGVAMFLKEQTLCTIGEAVRAMVPSAVLTRMTEVYRPLSPAAALETLDTNRHPEDKDVYDFLCRAGETPTQTLRKKFGSQTDDALQRLRSRGAIERDEIFRDVDAGEYISFYRPAVSEQDALTLAGGGSVGNMQLHSRKQQDVFHVLHENGGAMTEQEICTAVGCTAAVIHTMEVHKLLVKEQTRRFRFAYDPQAIRDAAPVVLNEQQRAVANTLFDFADSGEPHAALLHGITGSGKTSVMLALIAHLLGSGKGAIVLLPEIALTPQSVAVYCSHFGQKVAVIHSALSAGERYDAYERIRRGDAQVVIGTRSAVFSPVRSLGAIIIDEEQEHTYKSDTNPKYRAHDVARFRCAKSGALMLLASATPSLESYYKAMQGKYTLLRLTERYGRAVLPEVIIADTRAEAQAGNPSPLGTLLCQELVKNQADGQQSILFLNRRGYHRFVSCRSCGGVVTCPNCSVSMTYHTRRGTYAEGELICHFCGTRQNVPKVCPTCGSEHLSHNGYGTQRVEEELNHLLPDAKILRMDTDSTTSKFAYDDMLGKFRSHDADVLLGTQMVTKGHDFPEVTLVGVLSADSSLYLDDYRAGERTFALLTQVIGRAGRSEKRGRAVIQTANPDNDIIRLACRQDYETFYAREIKLRQLLVFPPFCDIAILSLSCEDEKELMLATRKLYNEVNDALQREYSDVKVVVFGPFEAPVYRVENKFRMRMVFKCKLTKRTRELFSHLLMTFGTAGGIAFSVDFNPSNL